MPRYCLGEGRGEVASHPLVATVLLVMAGVVVAEGVGRGARHRIGACTAGSREKRVTFAELVRLLEAHGFKLLKQKGSVRYYSKPGVDRLNRVA